MTELGSLSHCIMEGDSETRTRARWLRGKSLVISLGVEATVLAVLLLLPLLAPGVLPPLFVVTPAPPYRGETSPVQRNRAHENPPAHSSIPTPMADRPVLRPAGPPIAEEPPLLGTVIGDPRPPTGPGVPGGEDSATIVNLAPPQSATHKRPLVQGEGVMAARLIRRVQPDYPRIATLMRLSGVVRLRAIIGTDGSVRQLEVVSGNPILAQAAVTAVRQWHYEPTRLNGQPVEVETNITVRFVLN
jgi:protein TonB